MVRVPDVRHIVEIRASVPPERFFSNEDLAQKVISVIAGKGGEIDAAGQTGGTRPGSYWTLHDGSQRSDLFPEANALIANVPTPVDIHVSWKKYFQRSPHADEGETSSEGQ